MTTGGQSATSESLVESAYVAASQSHWRSTRSAESGSGPWSSCCRRCRPSSTSRVAADRAWTRPPSRVSTVTPSSGPLAPAGRARPRRGGVALAAPGRGLARCVWAAVGEGAGDSGMTDSLRRRDRPRPATPVIRAARRAVLVGPLVAWLATGCIGLLRGDYYAGLSSGDLEAVCHSTSTFRSRRADASSVWLPPRTGGER
jgi:hypothetical protein